VEGGIAIRAELSTAKEKIKGLEKSNSRYVATEIALEHEKAENKALHEELTSLRTVQEELAAARKENKDLRERNSGIGLVKQKLKEAEGKIRTLEMDLGNQEVVEKQLVDARNEIQALKDDREKTTRWFQAMPSFLGGAATGPITI
jgi:predicted RNase H-like nuclease (RuvC/YqgF family)